VDRPCLEQRTHLVQRRGVVAVRLAVDGHRATGRCVEAEDHPHRRRLPGTVGPEESGDNAWPHGKAEVVDRHLVPVLLRQAAYFDHLAALVITGASRPEHGGDRDPCVSRSSRLRSGATAEIAVLLDGARPVGPRCGVSHDDGVRRYDEYERPTGWLLIIAVAVLAAIVSMLSRPSHEQDRVTGSPPPVAVQRTPSQAAPTSSVLDDVLSRVSGLVAATGVCPVVTDHRTTMTVSFTMQDITPVREVVRSVTSQDQVLGPRATGVSIRPGSCAAASGQPTPPGNQVLDPGGEELVSLTYALPKTCPAPFPVQVSVGLSIADQPRAEQLVLLSDLSGVSFTTCASG
jgi:hypothetical protein